MHHNQLIKKPNTAVITLSPVSKLRLVMQVVVIGASSLAVLSGCQATKGAFGKIDDGSLAYQKSEKLDPIELPVEQETAPFVPLYPTPAVGVNTLDLENESGKRYELPAPHRQVAIESAE